MVGRVGFTNSPPLSHPDLPDIRSDMKDFIAGFKMSFTIFEPFFSFDFLGFICGFILLILVICLLAWMVLKIMDKV